MQKKKGIVFYLNYVEEVLLVIMLAVMTVLIFVQVVSRYVFNSSITWTEELARYMFVWLSWIGISLAAREGQHITIDAVTNLFVGKKIYNYINILANIIVIGICLVMLVEGVKITQKMYLIKSVSPMLKIPMGVCYLSVVVGCGLMVLRTVGQIAVWIRRLRSGVYSDEEEV